jgi:hypothetical protein
VKDDPILIVARIINVLLGFLGLIAVGLIVYAGFIYMTSGADPKKVEQSKTIMKNALIGLVIIMSAFAIVSFIINKLSEVTGAGSGGQKQFAYVTPGLGNGALGRVIQDHFPGVGMTVPRNTTILVTFIDPIRPSSVIDTNITCTDTANATWTCTGADCDNLVPNTGKVCKGAIKKDSFKLYKACDSDYPSGANAPDSYATAVRDANREKPEICNEWRGEIPPTDPKKLVGGELTAQMENEVVITPDFRTIMVNPFGFSVDQHLGSSLNDVTYLAQLENNIKNTKNPPTGVFSTQNIKYYMWNFTTNTLVDVTPPYVVGAYPIEVDDNGQPIAGVSNGKDNTGYARNTRIRVDFSEPIIPPVYQNISPATDQSMAEAWVSEGTNRVTGDFIIGNGYKSVVFRANGDCGVGVQYNSCGQPLTCLPGNKTITVLANTVPGARLINGTGPTANTFPAGGIVDAALNALDAKKVNSFNQFGPGNGQTEGTDADDFSWQFKTSDLVDLIAPKIHDIFPNLATGSVNLREEVGAVFTKSMDPSTVNNSSSYVYSSTWDGWYTATLACPIQTSPDGSKFCLTDDTKVMINHAPFNPAKTNEVPIYYPLMTSLMQDMSGNCFNPANGDGTSAAPSCAGLAEGVACCATYPGTATMNPQTGKSTCPYSQTVFPTATPAVK